MRSKIAWVLAVVFIVWLSAGCAARFDLPIVERDVTIAKHVYKVIHVSGNYGQSYIHDPECLRRDFQAWSR